MPRTQTKTGEAFLEAMARDSAQRASAGRARISEKELRRKALEMPPAKYPKLSGSGFDLIAEVKFRSPSGGDLLAQRSDPEEALRLAQAYAQAGAAMVSVLTQASAFRGSLEHLRRVAHACPIPVMRKDFLVDTYQVWEARAAGADCALIVIRILDDRQASALLDACGQAGMLALLEAFDADDLKRAHRLLRKRREQEVLLGVNNRDLGSLQVDVGHCLKLGPRLPIGFKTVAESGLESASHARQVARAGFRLGLVGSALMRSPDPRTLIRSMLRAGRAEANRER